ncbi:hypothetical protein HDU67_009948 [Dinochytrium kinnereticum]|nr:hypothetical protein HDU67_009948 [Dinochytrium kinnereticum]
MSQSSLLCDSNMAVEVESTIPNDRPIVCLDGRARTAPTSPSLQPTDKGIESRGLWRHLSSFSSIATIDFNPAVMTSPKMADGVQTPLPKKIMFILCIVIFSEPMSMTILFPFVYFMVKDFLFEASHDQANEKDIGYYVGFIASSFSLAQFLTSMFWGWCSDRVGRRPVLLLGLLGNTVTILLFGVSHSLSWAILSRAACGFLNGNIGVAKCVMGEVTDSTNQAKGFSMFGLMWGIGMICGPVLGGFLANPTKQFPALFGNCPFLAANPYFLPCLISAIISLTGFTVGFFFLEETSQTSGAYAPLPTRDDVEAKSIPAHVIGDRDADLENEGCSSTRPTILRTSRTNSSSATGARDSVFTQVNELVDECDEMEEKVTEGPKASFIGYAAIHAIVGYGMLSFQNIIFDETFSLWVVTPLADVYPYLSRFFSPVTLYKLAACCYISIFPIFPIVSTFIAGGSPSLKAWTWPALLLNMAGRHFCNVLGFTSVMIMINNAAGKANLGIVNGIGQTTAAFVRSIGPALGGIMWAWSLNNHLAFPLNYWFVFFILSLLAIATALQSRFIPDIKTPADVDDANVHLMD